MIRQSAKESSLAPAALESVQLATGEKRLLAELLDAGNREISISIPDDLGSDKILGYIRTLGSALGKTERAKTILIAALGRALYLARQNPDVLEMAGCKTITELEEQELLGRGVSRPSIWAASSAYETLPELTVNDCVEIGPTKLRDAVQALRGKSASESQRKRVIEAAKQPREKFHQRLEAMSLVQSGELDGASYALHGSKAEIEELKQLLGSTEARTHAGTDRPIGIILAMFAEASSQFVTEQPAAAGGDVSAEEEEWF